jgi:hypothetical protein
MTGAPLPRDRSVDAFRRFAADQHASISTTRWGLLEALVKCAEEIADHDVFHARMKAAAAVRERVRRGLGISAEMGRHVKCLYDYPFAYSDPRITVIRAPARIRLAMSVRKATSSPYAITKITEPSFVTSKSKTLKRAVGRGENARKARSTTFSQARNTVLGRLASDNVDRYLIAAPSEEQADILEEWGRRNGYPSLAHEPDPRFDGLGVVERDGQLFPVQSRADEPLEHPNHFEQTVT